MDSDTEVVAGWTLAGIRALEPSAALLVPADHSVALMDGDDLVTVMPLAMLGFGELCLCLVVDEGGPEWWMGTLGDDGQAVCWAHYDDLESAIRGL